MHHGSALLHTAIGIAHTSNTPTPHNKRLYIERLVSLQRCAIPHHTTLCIAIGIASTLCHTTLCIAIGIASTPFRSTLCIAIGIALTHHMAIPPTHMHTRRWEALDKSHKAHWRTISGNIKLIALDFESITLIVFVANANNTTILHYLFLLARDGESRKLSDAPVLVAVNSPLLASREKSLHMAVIME